MVKERDGEVPADEEVQAEVTGTNDIQCIKHGLWWSWTSRNSRKRTAVASILTI